MNRGEKEKILDVVTHLKSTASGIREIAKDTRSGAISGKKIAELLDIHQEKGFSVMINNLQTLTSAKVKVRESKSSSGKKHGSRRKKISSESAEERIRKILANAGC